MEESLLKKRQILRNNEYYDIQEVFDSLYKDSCNNKKFTNLMQYIMNERNIELAYRNIKRNDGSVTPGTDNLTIEYIENMKHEEFINRIRSKFENYNPKSVRRVEIPKPNGKTRPLGIPCIEDRLIQQCIKQVLEPICEAKFHNHSYGFRPNRSAEHAIKRSMHLMHAVGLHYVVDIDIKGFFDNVCHSKLKKQIWSLGIQDKNLITIIGKILKSEIQGIGIPSKGTPQGGIISPLLSNIVLNELDWWLSSQWETYETHEKSYTNNDHKRHALKKRKLKEIYFVRYADDFKIFCRDWRTAQKIYIATRNWLKERLGLEISPEKSKITNLRKNYTEFLGFKIKVYEELDNGKIKYKTRSYMTDKAKKATIKKLNEQIKRLYKNQCAKEVNRMNSMILGTHNYYKIATMISKDMSEISFLVNRTLYNRLKLSLSDKPNKSETYKRLYGDYRGKTYTIANTTIFPIYGCKFTPPQIFNQEICNYTKKGRALVHDKLRGIGMIIEYLLNTKTSESAEYFDNRISKMVGQKGRCYVTKVRLEIGNMECHHKKPKYKGGTDEYKNLVWLEKGIHKLVHAETTELIQEYLEKLKLDKECLGRVNSLRKLVGNSAI